MHPISSTRSKINHLTKNYSIIYASKLSHSIIEHKNAGNFGTYNAEKYRIALPKA